MEQKLMESKPVCEYLGVYVVFKLCFNTYINVVLEKLGKQSGIVSKLRNCAAKSIDTFLQNIQPTIQFGVFIYGCCRYTSLPNAKLHEK